MLNLMLPLKPAGAYGWLTCGDDKVTWSEECDGCARMKISTTSMPIGGSFDIEFQEAMDAWDNVGRSDFNFILERDTDGSHRLGNGDNEVYFFATDGPGDTLAVTHLRTNSCTAFDDADIKEADVEFDSAETWYTSAFSYTSSNTHFRLVALHELGHALGLLHEDDVMATMNTRYPNGGPITRDKEVRPLGNDRLGLRFLYPGDGTLKADLVPSNYKRNTATAISGDSALVSGPTSASRGSSVTIDFTFMNIGSADSGEFNIGFYLSTNDTISTGDRLLGSNIGASVGDGGVVTSSRTLTIPSDVSPGTYYIGILLDRDGDVVEFDDGDNGLAQPRTILINN
jgi:hypothetical protein